MEYYSAIKRNELSEKEAMERYGGPLNAYDQVRKANLKIQNPIYCLILTI